MCARRHLGLRQDPVAWLQDVRDLICSDSLDVGGWSGKTKTLVANHSLPYRGDLRVRCVPKGAVLRSACPMSS